MVLILFKQKCATIPGKGLDGRMLSCKVYTQHCAQPQQCMEWSVVQAPEGKEQLVGQ
jgi:hypothetical protein